MRPDWRDACIVSWDRMKAGRQPFLDGGCIVPAWSEMRAARTAFNALSDQSNRSVEHVGLPGDEVIPDRLEMQPADVFAPHMLAAIAGPLRRDELRRNAGCI